ncbi:MAG: T9SS type A sorting domain-containing protein [Melioribacteraceae bacterium]|nr:T9SS type A sorting domain-containing protein [Melioribacteraceae bacterium]
MNTIKFIIIALLILFVSSETTAQITIDGTITDSELNPISNALVEIIDEGDTTNYYTSTTNESGYFLISNITGIGDAKTSLPSDFIVLRNYPNPFNPSTIIYYELPKAENIEIKIYDILGREVITLYNGFHKAGTYTLNWDGRNDWNSSVSAGIYFCRLKTKDQFKVNKMVLLDGGSNVASKSNLKTQNEDFQKLTKAKIHFNYSLRVSCNTIIESEFENLTCSGDTTINKMVPRILKSATIGLEGGKLETEEFLLTIPSGAFNELSKINFAIDPNDTSLSENTASPLFLISGIPDSISNSLLIGIKPENPSIENLLMAVRQNRTSLGYPINEQYFNIKHVFDSLGYYFCKIEGEFFNAGSRSNILSKTINNNTERNLSLKLVKGYESVSDGFLDYYYPDKYSDDISVLRLLLLEVPFTFINIGFTGERFSGWNVWAPMEVQIGKLNNYFIRPLRFASLVSYNNLQINNKYLSAEYLTDIRREFAHLYYYRYFFYEDFDKKETYKLDGRKWLENDPFLRVLHHAIATWLEETFQPIISTYVPNSFKGNEMQIFKGFVTGANLSLIISDEYKHGYGLASLIKFLMNKYGTNLLFDFYQNIYTDKLPSSEAFLKAIEERNTLANNRKVSENIWLPEFFKEYISGNIYNLPGEEFLTSVSETIEFNDGDTLKYVDETYNDLSAKLFKIKINSEEIKTKTINFKIDSSGINIDYVKTLVFGVSNNNLTFLAEGTDFNVSYFQAYDALLACVVNSGNEPPYTGTSKINLEIKVTDDLAFRHCDINFAVVEFHDTLEGTWSPGWYTDGVFKDNVYIGTINSDKQGGNANGSIRIEMDDNQNIIYLDVMAYHSDQYGSSQWGFTASNITPTENEPYLLVYSYSGYNVCNYVNSIYAKYTYANGDETEIRNFKCDEESVLHVKFHNWD